MCSSRSTIFASVAIPQADIISTGILGWPQITATTAEAYRAQPPGTAVVTHAYWTAGALRYYVHMGLHD